MKLVDIAKEPTLIKLTLDDEETIAEYGEALEFWCYDRQPLDTFMRVGSRAGDTTAMVDVMKELILHEDGTPVMRDKLVLPNRIMLRAVNKMVEQLGK